MTRRLHIPVVVWLMLPLSAWAWWGNGHARLTRAAMMALPDTMPKAFRDGATLAAHVAIDPDLSKQRATPFAREAEYPEHYFDLEYLQGREVPATRSGMMALCVELGLDAKRVGLLPYAVAEWTERLAVAFAEMRKWPDNEAIVSKSLVYAGFLAHYAEDLGQPLHLTIHFNGRVGKDGKSPHSGMHARVDALVEKAAPTVGELARDQNLPQVDSLFGFILEQLSRNRTFIDSLYALEGVLATAGTDSVDARVRSLTVSLSRAAVNTTAALYRYAWQRSASIPLEDWLDRPTLDKGMR